VIVVLFLVIIGAITFLALHRWSAPTNRSPDTSSEAREIVLIEAGGEVVSFDELLRSVAHDVVKISAHTHVLGVAAEYKWIEKRYPGSKPMNQKLTTLDLLEGKEYGKGQVHFDLVTIKLANGQSKEIYFDITSFFDGYGTSMAPKAFITKKLQELYRSQSETKGAKMKQA